MKFGLSTQSFFNRLNTESSIDIIRQMMVGSCEVHLATFSEYEESYINKLLKRVGNMQISAVHPAGKQFEPELFSANARVRADAENIFNKVCYSAHMLGAKYYIFRGPMKIQSKNYVFDYIRLGDRINQLAEIARSYGILLSYENVFYCYGDNPDYFKQLLRQCPSIYTTLSVKQALMSGIDPIKFVDAMEGRISSINVCDMKKNGSTALPGQGTYNFEKFFNFLNKRSVNANIVLEANGSDYTDVNQLKSAFDYICGLWVRCCN